MTVKSVASTHEVETLDHVFGDMEGAIAALESLRERILMGDPPQNISLGDDVASTLGLYINHTWQLIEKGYELTRWQKGQ